MAQTDSTRSFESVMDSLGLAPRPQQQALAGLAREVIGAGKIGFIQAGTGVGKSFVALSVGVEARDITDLPSVVICPTNRLIDQYIHKDAPRVAKATGADIQYLKGRSNYLCAESYGFETQFGREALTKFTEMTKDGRLEWAQHYGLDSSYGCDGNCDNAASTCAVQLARQRAATADVIVTNGHMLVYDRLIQEWTDFQSRLLPLYGALFVDECHELDQVARNCLSDSIGPGAEVYKRVPDLMPWVMSLITEAGLSSKEREVAVDPADPELRQMADEAESRCRHLKLKLDGAKAMGDKDTKKAIRREIKALERLIEFAEPYDENSLFVSTVSVEPDQMYPGGLKPSLNRVCVDAAPTVRPILQEQASVLISGTVPPSLPKRLGVIGTPLSDVGTPFDYTRSVLAVSDRDPRDFNDQPKRLSELKGAILDMAARSHDDGGGGTLVLVTSWDDLDRVGQYLAATLPHDIPIFTQARNDPADTADMLEQFADHGHAVMIGVRTLWTGVDVPGPALRQVAIWKLPYAVPDILSRAIEARYGRQVYKDDMMQLLTQGIGRLVRTLYDDGRVVIFDNRAKSMAWSVNPMSRHISSFKRFRRRA